MTGDVGECHSLPRIFFLDECAPTHVSLARIDPIVSPHSVKGQQAILHPLPFGQSLHQWQRILVQLVLLFARPPRLCRMLQRQNGRHPQGSSDRTWADSSSTPRCDFTLLIISPSSHTFCISFYRTLCHITDYLIRPAASRIFLGARIHRAFSSQTRLMSLQFPLGLIRFLQT
ncbi:hypothetical protein BU25DRAFT_205114 [Macroventuria anomochaeta]|uniref:Uncharacterized protein n=1 Tax=Macroventuria anomochaeta TaxID=301207 RepID=A0ACB6RL58_9PLEO|nr:uncharacterized protein BU25DRAFT_205114 [Macroventuria anomochaeta]KAF2622746.1 hypothetical protein BU25DRAFT_205114 [Macroventuria anomochaeta]